MISLLFCRRKEEEVQSFTFSLFRLILNSLRNNPRSFHRFNLVTLFLTDFMKPGHDQYVHRHANGYVYDSLCTIAC